VNLAARLEPLNKEYGTEVLVSDAVRQRAADRFAFRLVDETQPKGFAAKVRVYELCGAVQERVEMQAGGGVG
jgi:adenylate cyclase